VACHTLAKSVEDSIEANQKMQALFIGNLEAVGMAPPYLPKCRSVGDWTAGQFLPGARAMVCWSQWIRRF
jgi:hypothetical protein